MVCQRVLYYNPVPIKDPLSSPLSRSGFSQTDPPRLTRGVDMCQCGFSFLKKALVVGCSYNSPVGREADKLMYVTPYIICESKINSDSRMSREAFLISRTQSKMTAKFQR